jgi:hypothetical protein
LTSAGGSASVGEVSPRAPAWIALRGVVLAALLGAAADRPAPPETFEGRGVYYFRGSVDCPLAGIGSRAADLSNRLGLDDEHSRVTVDRAAHRIVFRNTHRYPRRRIVGDLVFLAVGTTARGERAPLGIHLKVEKEGDRLSARTHPHPTVRDKVVAARFEPFEVILANGDTETVALTAKTALETVQEPELTARLANILLRVTDNLDGVAVVPEQPRTRLVDLSIGFGADRLNWKVARVQLLSLEARNAPLIAHGSLAEMFRTGAWEMRITALSPVLPKEEFDRDLFLLGLDDMPVLRDVKQRGLWRGQSLVCGFRDGKGFIGVDDARAEIPNPADVARAYLEFNFVGGVIARQLTALPARSKRTR